MKNKAIFFDRDGVINDDKDHYYVTSPDLFELNKGITELMKHFREKGYLMIVVSNQGGIAKNLYTHEDVAAIHDKMNRLLQAEGLHFDEIYYCPHHPDTGKCICRKPGTLFFEKALSRFNIDPAVSYFIGDRDSDEEAGKRAGLNTIKIERNSNPAVLIKLFS